MSELETAFYKITNHYYVKILFIMKKYGNR
jgi:hypothetical protein